MTDPEIITLNVGGVLYTTTRTTLTKYPDSILGAMFNESLKPSTQYKDGHIFIDRDGQMFKFVLEFLRSGKLSLPDDFTEKDSLLAECDYFQILPLITEMQKSFGKKYCINIMKVVSGTSKCELVIEGTTTAISKIPAEYLDMETRATFQEEKEEIEDTLDRITLECSTSSSKEKTEAVITTLERALRDSGWVESAYNPLPYLFHDEWYKEHEATVKERKTWFFQVKGFLTGNDSLLRELSNISAMTDAEITLNVGGVFYTTTRTTLTKYPDSMLGAMFGGSMKPSTLYKDGPIFIDRDGQMFKIVLEFLRSGKLSLPDDFREKGGLRAECDYFQILPLITELQKSFGKQYCIDIMKLVSDTSECELVIEGTTTAISKIPAEYLDLETRAKFQEKKGEIKDTIDRITLECSPSHSKEKTEAVITTLERALRDSGWVESEYNPLPFYHDNWYKVHKASLKERKTWFYFLTDRDSLSRACRCMSNISAMTDAEIITLNVGGVLYTTTRTTLTKYPDSMLGAMFNRSMKPSTLYKDGLIFIDRDGQMFKFVLEFLRSETLSLPDDFTDTDSLLAEAEFFQIQPLISKLHEALSRNHFINIYKWDNDKQCFLIVEVPAAVISKIPAEYIDMDTRVRMRNSKDKSTKIFALKFQCSFDSIETNTNYLNFERAMTDNGWVKSNYTALPYFPDNPWYKNNKENKNCIRERASWHHK